PGIGRQKQTFEELLEEQLQLEEQRLKSVQQQQSHDGAVKAPPKRAFLKRGQGLSRFTNNRKASLPKMEVDSQPQPQARVISCSNSAPASIQKGGINGVQRLPVQRKTAVLNKENRLRKGMEPNNRKVGLPAQTIRKPGFHNKQLNPVTKQVGMLGGPGRADSDAPKEKNCGSRVESAEGKTGSDGGGAEGDGVPQDTFELSFQEKLQHWECERHLESVELGEFELLEQAAEELSFSSNSSFVMKQQRQLQAARGLHQGRLSSTPIKSPPKEVLQRPSSVDSGDDLLCKSSSVTLEAFVAKVGYDPLKNKVSIEDKEKQDSDVSSCGGSEFEDQEVAVKPPSFPSTICFPAQSNPPYDKRSYQDDDVCRGSASDVTQGDDDSDGVLSNGDESTLIEEKDGPQGRVVFDDDDTWNDLEDPPVGPPSRGFSPVSKASGISHPEQTLLGKVPVSKFVELDKDTVTSSAKLKLDPPPASQLMTKLFPSLKLGAQSAPLPSPLASVAPESKRSEGDTGETNTCRFLSITCISIQLRERLAELEIEIERFKKENATLARLRQENEKKQEDLSKERLEFEQVKAEEMAKFEEYKKEENRKLQKERKLFEKHASAARAMPDKKEREEIQALKQQLSSLQEELRRKESRWASTRGRLRQQIDSLSQENSSLRNEVFTPFTLEIFVFALFSFEAEKPESAQEVITHPDGKIEKVLASGERLTIFPNGTTKEVSADGLMVKVTFFNGDTKQITADQRVIYYYADAQTIHITYPDGMEVLHFPNNQTEKHFPDGRKEITFPDQTVKSLFPDGREESVLTDGTIIQVNPDGTKEIHFNTGQKEIHTADYKRREYPDGTVKTVYNDGRQETRYPNGQLRIKDKDGNITLDNSLEPLSLNK
uniref:Centromere protein J n=1 Tax=Monopterus albus TaxID=43700 RepID=A0A3Q3K887_MONAL